MSQAEELLNSLSAGDTTETATEGHIIIGNDRFITVPEELKRIGVQYDHNIETVTFDCPRYWDGLDMSQMVVYINYMLPDRTKGCYIADNVTADDTDDTIMHFDWTISRNVTQVKGDIFFLVCIKKTDENGDEVNHWNSELCKDIYISEGLECEEVVFELYPDIITSLLERMDAIENITVDVNTNEIDTFKAGKTDYTYTGKYNRGELAIAVDTDIDIGVAMYDYRFILVNYRREASERYNSHLDMTQNSNLIYDVIYANNMFVGVGENGCIRYSNYNDLVSTDESGSITSINDDTWTEITVGDRDFKGIAYGNGTFVAIGDNGNLAYSTDGVTWTNKILYGGHHNFETICYDGTKFIALGHNDELPYRVINAYSEDGIIWSIDKDIVVPARTTIYDVIYANNKYVAVGTNGVILYSEDAITWNAGVSENIRGLRSVTYGNGKFVAVGGGVILYSEDGIHWTIVTGVESNTCLVKYANNTFVTYPMIYTSKDGINWSPSITSETILYFSFPIYPTENLAYCNGRFLATSHSIEFGVYSDDGINWSAYVPHCGSERVKISNLISYNGIFMGFGAWNGDPVYTSLDGINWVKKAPCNIGIISQSSQSPLHAYGNGKLIVASCCSSTTTKIAYTEDDGESWGSAKLENVELYDMAYGNGIFVGVGKSNIIAYSPDGLNWTTSTIDFTLQCITYNDGKFVGVGDNTDKTSFSAYSTDGITWVKMGVIEDGPYDFPKEIIYEKGQYICCYGGSRFVFSSFDGKTWTKITSETDIKAIVYGKGKFVSHAWGDRTFAYSVYKTEQKTLSDAINNILTVIDEQSATIDKSLGDIQTALAAIVEVSE